MLGDEPARPVFRAEVAAFLAPPAPAADAASVLSPREFDVLPADARRALDGVLRAHRGGRRPPLERRGDPNLLLRLNAAMAEEVDALHALPPVPRPVPAGIVHCE